MRRVVAIAGGLCLVGVLTYLLRREASSTPEPGRADDSPWIVPDDDARDGVLQGALEGPGRARGTVPSPSDRVGTTASDAGPGADAKGMVPLRPHLRLTILDEDGRPIAGARVEALAKPSDDVFRDPEMGESLGAEETDADGRFRFVFADERRPAALRISAPGRPAALFYAHTATGVLRLPSTTRVRGRVLANVSGGPVPVAGALIEARSPDRVVRMFVPSGPIGLVRSESDGTFTMNLAGDGLASLTANGPNGRGEALEVRIGAGALSGVTLFVPASGEQGVAEGRVLLDGRPTAGVRVGLRPSVARSRAVWSDLSGPDGVYRVGPVWDGVEKVVVDATAIGMGWSRLWARFEVKDGRAVEDVVLPRSWSISGRVTRGVIPVVGALIAARPTLGDTEAGFAAATTDGSGTFRVVGCFDRRPTVSISVTAPEGDSAVDGVPFDASLWDVTGEAIDLAAFGRIRGRVLDADARPIAGARVHARTDVLSGPDGRFDVLADPGNARVSVSCDGFIDRTSAWVHVPNGERGADADVILRRGGTISGRVRDAGGRGIVGAIVEVVGIGGIGGTSTVRVYAANGAFVSQAVAGDALRVTVSADGFTTRVFENVGPDAELPDVVLEPRPGAPAPR